MQLILHSKFKWASLSRRVRKEQRNREKYSPTISTYRWWARRSHALVGALIEEGQRVLGEQLVVSDPMAGGGTVAVEAARRGLVVYAQDVNPWAAFGLQATLEPVDPDQLAQAAEQLIQQLDQADKALYRLDDNQRVINRLHVRRCACPHCEKPNYLFPSPLVALESRVVANPTHCWLGCIACGKVHRGSWPDLANECIHCGVRYSKIPSQRRRSSNPMLNCVHCTKQFDTSIALQKSAWNHVLDVTMNGNKLGFIAVKRPLQLLGRNIGIRDRLQRSIPKAGETAALIRNGFTRWEQLFPERQLAVLDEALSALNADVFPSPVRHRLLLALAGFSEMAGYACRWDPKYRKAYEVTANHHYARATLAAETNPAGPMGRGTLPKRLRAAVKAARWFPGSAISRVICGSSEKQPIPDHSVDLVITDPPYYDSVKYAELSRLFRNFAAALGLSWSDEVEQTEAVLNHKMGCTHEEYVSRLTRIFSETCRTVKPTGRMLLTFHSNQIRAWEAVGDSLKNASWAIVSVAVVHSENEKDHSKNGKQSITCDAVLECIPKFVQKRLRVLARSGVENQSARNVLSMAAAVARYVNTQENNLKALYFRQAKKNGVKRITIK